MNDARRPLLIAANVIGYQLVWLASIAGAGHANAWLGPVVAVAFVVATLLVGGKCNADLRTIGLVLPLGIALDSMFAVSGWMNYAQAWPWPNVAPIWIWTLWAAFAMTLNHSLAFLADRRWLGALLGLIGGPLAYWSAANAFDAVEFGVPAPWVLIALALSWGSLLPVMISLNKRLTPARDAFA